jgi:site-specific recombinase XerD
MAGIEGYRLHDKRHTFASHLVSSGLSLEVMGRLLGHTSAETTKRYAHLADDALQDVAEAFGGRFSR